MKAIKTVRLSSGKTVPVLGQGTWEMGDDIAKRPQEIEALRTGLDLGMSLIDTAEMYANGGAEEVVSEAIKGRRNETFIVTKVLPQNASRKGTVEACEKSLQRLKTDYIDLYLLHWRGSFPLEETFAAFRSLKKAGKILNYGVSNFDVSDMEEALALVEKDEIVTNQVLYNLNSRGIEWDLLPWCQERKISIMAYTPIGSDGKLLNHPTVKQIATRHSATPAQVALAWVLRQRGVITIPKASNPQHVVANRAALDLRLTAEDLKELDQAFPPPSQKIHLEMI